MSPVKSPLKATLEDPLRILIVRPDRIGDVVLSTPVISVIHRNYPDAKLTFMVQSHLVPILTGIPGLTGTLVYDPAGRHHGLKGIFRLARDIRAGRFRIVVALQTHWRLGLAILLSGVRYRVGPWSKLHSYLVYNRGVRQRRSEVEMHEADYNLQLLRKIGIRLSAHPAPTQVALPTASRVEAEAWLVAQGWKKDQPLVVVHPGMGGSALNWPETHYSDLVRRLLTSGVQVLLTGGRVDQATVDRVFAGVRQGAVVPGASTSLFVMRPEESRSLEYLAGLLSLANVVVAPSTGPLHVAVALGKRVVTFYPPIRVQSALRWGPYVKDDSQATVLHPEVYCGEDFTCRGSECHYFPCMKTVTSLQAFEEVTRHLREGSSR